MGSEDLQQLGSGKVVEGKQFSRLRIAAPLSGHLAESPWVCAQVQSGRRPVSTIREHDGVLALTWVYCNLPRDSPNLSECTLEEYTGPLLVASTRAILSYSAPVHTHTGCNVAQEHSSDRHE